MARSVKIGVYGMEEAPGFLVRELRAIGLDARELDELTVGSLSGLDILHVFFPPMAWRGFIIAKFLGLRTVAHWVGSDVLMVRGQRRSKMALRMVKPFIDLHLVDHYPLADELAVFGFSARHHPTLSGHLSVRVIPWPEEPAVLCYTPPDRQDFYGVPAVLRLAQSLPDVPFISCGCDSPPEGAPANWEHLGVVSEMESVYRRTGVLIRLTRHDGMARMVLETLGYGRRVIWTQPLPHVVIVQDGADLPRMTRTALAAGPNPAGRKMIELHCNLRRNTYRLCDYYRLLLGRSLG